MVPDPSLTIASARSPPGRQHGWTEPARYFGLSWLRYRYALARSAEEGPRLDSVHGRAANSAQMGLPKRNEAAIKRRMEPGYQGTFTGARRYVLETFANTKSALMKKRVSQYIIGRDCPTCHGKRLKREALSVKFAGLDIAEFGDLSLLKLRDLLTPVAHGDFARADITSGGDVLDKKSRSAAVARRVAAGGSAHKSAPDVRRTPNLSEEKRIAANVASELLERLVPPSIWTWMHLLVQHANAIGRTANACGSQLVFAVVRRGLCAGRTVGRTASGGWAALPRSCIVSRRRATRCSSSTTRSPSGRVAGGCGPVPVSKAAA